ncbi:MAG TPA: signal peptidase II [Vicinamibacterales bacterium]|nr:signal peptidase II [Vicinamibacterales bacterium]
MNATPAGPAAATPSPRHRSAWRPLLLIALPIFVADQATKAFVRQVLVLHDSLTVIPGLVELTHVRNTGAAFGILNSVEFPFKPIVMMLIAFGALIAIGVYAVKLGAHERLARTGLALILGGAVGNLLDRAMHGYVLDFVDVYYGTVHFWAFNVADASISVGAVLVLFEVIFSGRQHASAAV